MPLNWLKQSSKRKMLILLLLVALIPVGWLLYSKGPLGPPKVTVASVQQQSF